jgi:hypothetical protein
MGDQLLIVSMAAAGRVARGEPDEARKTKKVARSVPAYQEAYHLRSLSFPRSEFGHDFLYGRSNTNL